MEELGRDLGYYLVTLPTKAKVFLYAIPVVLSANCEYISSTGVITSRRWFNKASHPMKLTAVTLAPIGAHSPLHHQMLPHGLLRSYFLHV